MVSYIVVAYGDTCSRVIVQINYITLHVREIYGFFVCWKRWTSSTLPRRRRLHGFTDVAQAGIVGAAARHAQLARIALYVDRMATGDRVGVVADVVLVHPIVALLVLRVLDHGAPDGRGLVHHDLRKVSNILAVRGADHTLVVSSPLHPSRGEHS